MNQSVATYRQDVVLHMVSVLVLHTHSQKCSAQMTKDDSLKGEEFWFTQKYQHLGNQFLSTERFHRSSFTYTHTLTRTSQPIDVSFRFYEF